MVEKIKIKMKAAFHLINAKSCHHTGNYNDYYRDSSEAVRLYKELLDFYGLTVRNRGI